MESTRRTLGNVVIPRAQDLTRVRSTSESTIWLICRLVGAFRWFQSLVMAHMGVLLSPHCTRAQAMLLSFHVPLELHSCHSRRMMLPCALWPTANRPSSAFPTVAKAFRRARPHKVYDIIIWITVNHDWQSRIILEYALRRPNQLEWLFGIKWVVLIYD